MEVVLIVAFVIAIFAPSLSKLFKQIAKETDEEYERINRKGR